MKRRKLIIIISILVILSIAVTAFAILKSQKDNKIVWNTVHPEVGDIQILVTATGTLNAVKTVLVGTQVSGTISKIFVDFNDNVKAGQVIALLDERNLQLSLDEAEANLSKAQAQLDQVKAEYERNQELFNKGLISQSDLDVQLSNFKTAQDNVSTSEGEVKKAKVNLSYASIVSPINGVIVSRNVDVGQTVAASFNTPTLFSIANDLKEMQLQANVDEADIGKVKTGQQVYFKVDAYPDITFNGTVQQLRMQPITTNNVVSYAVMIDAPNDDLKLLPGMNADISIVVQERKNILKVPISAMTFLPGKSQEGMDSITVQHTRDSLSASRKSLVFIQNNGKPIPVVIETGLSDGIYFEVKEGALTRQDDLIIGMRTNGNISTPDTRGLFQRPGGNRPPGGQPR